MDKINILKIMFAIQIMGVFDVIIAEPVQNWSPGDLAFKGAKDYENRDDYSRDQAVANWKQVLQMKDLTEFQKLHAFWRIGCLYAYNINWVRGERPNDKLAMEAYETILSRWSNIVCTETLNTTSIYATMGGTPTESAKRCAIGYRWFATRT